MAGLAISGRGRNFVGRIGATERPPCEDDVSVRVRETGALLETSAVLGAADDVEEVEAVRTGENDDIADPGRAGRFFVASVAFF